MAAGLGEAAAGTATAKAVAAIAVAVPIALGLKLGKGDLDLALELARDEACERKCDSDDGVTSCWTAARGVTDAPLYGKGLMARGVGATIGVGAVRSTDAGSWTGVALARTERVGVGVTDFLTGNGLTSRSTDAGGTDGGDEGSPCEVFEVRARPGEGRTFH